ncbi:MAG: 23S rRNA (pseudouridine(1915)-N(3))-methyltransferase RlmH, partial [Candidatus Gracilibacteria bacterium]
GPYGLSEAVKSRANILLSLSKLTFTHQMIRMFLLEQIYRGFCISTGKEYHNVGKFIIY